GSRHGLQRIGDEALERGVAPDDPRAPHRFRIGEPGDAAGAPAEEPAMARPGAVVFERVAGEAARVDLLAAPRIARGGKGLRACGHDERGRKRATRLHATNAIGTGGSPSALRSTAQCIASSPRMLAAALARSRSWKTGTAPRYALTAPFSSDAAKRSTSACVLSFSVGKAYFAFAATGFPPSFST